MTSAPSTCRDCREPIEWRDTDRGRRPFDPDGRPHFETCSEARPRRQNGSHATPPSPARDREIRRMAVLKAAATFAAGRCLGGTEVKSNDVLAIAEAWERWVQRGGDQPA
jgi:hypothetical protein